MEDGGPTATYLIFLALLFLNMLFYGFGEAVQELNIKELAEEAENSKNKKAARLYEIADKPTQYIGTVQFLVTLINLIMGGFFLQIWKGNVQGFLDKKVMGQWLQTEADPVLLSMLSYVLSGALLLYIILTFGVLIPKRLGVRYAKKWSYACINPVYYITVVFSPFTGLVAVTCKGILRLFGIRGDISSEDVTEEEIISMVNEGHEQGVLLATEAEMITNIFEFGDKEAHDIMTHRKNILSIDRNMILTEALDFMLCESKSRFPVYDENIDQITGILHFRDVMRAHRKPENLNVPIGEIEGLVREAMFVPETKHIDDLFKTMQQEKIQMVIVVDEYGQTSGLLAMEDILEEIVGNIMDEYDEDEEYIEETENANEYLIDGITPLEEVEEKLEISFEEEEFETLNGFLISKIDRIPEDNEQFFVDAYGYKFKILTVENRMIKSVLVTKMEAEQDTEETKEEIPGHKEKKEQEKGE